MGNIASIILAAGFSSRMQGLFKPLLPLPIAWPSPRQVTLLENLIELHISCGVKNIFIVIGTHQSENITNYIKNLQTSSRYKNKIHLVQNPTAELGMFSSVCKGLHALKEHKKKFTHFFMHPVDIALVRYCTLQILINASYSNKNVTLIPSYQGKNGHPPLIPTLFIEQILTHNGVQGLYGVLKNLAKLEVAAPDNNILLDMDTVNDYKVMQKKATVQHILQPREALELLHCRNIPAKGIAHAQSVARIASTFAKQYVKTYRNYNINIALTKVGAILHDMCKFEPNHEQAAAKALSQMGLAALAPLVRQHNDCKLDANLPVSEKELIYLADKYVFGSDVISINERFEQKLKLYAHIPEAVCAIKARLGRAQAMEQRVAYELNLSPFNLAKQCLRENK